MSKLKKLLTLKKSAERLEQETLLSKREVERVVSERQDILDLKSKKLLDLNEKLSVLLVKQRNAALLEGDVGHINSINSYMKRVRKDILALGKVVEEKKTELKKALERVKIVEDEFLEARIERKKIDKLIENYKHEEQVMDVAKDEMLSDEISVRSFGRKKGFE